MMEEADVLLNEDNAELLGRAEDGLVILTTAWRRDVLCTRARCTVDIVREGELEV